MSVIQHFKQFNPKVFDVMALKLVYKNNSEVSSLNCSFCEKVAINMEDHV